MIAFDGVLGLVTLALWLFCIIDVITSDDSGIRNLPKMAWLFLVIILPLVGSVAWLVAGRPQGAGASGLPYKGNRGSAGSGHRGFSGNGVRARGFTEPDRKGYSRHPSAYQPPEPAPRAVNPDDDAEFQAQLRRRVDEQRRRARGDGDTP